MARASGTNFLPHGYHSTLLSPLPCSQVRPGLWEPHLQGCAAATSHCQLLECQPWALGLTADGDGTGAEAWRAHWWPQAQWWAVVQEEQLPASSEGL